MILREASTPSCVQSTLIKTSIKHKDSIITYECGRICGECLEALLVSPCALSRDQGNAPVPWLVRIPSTVLSRHPQQ